MNDAERNTVVPLSMLFELAREDNPRLYDDLVRFNKGPKRLNRLRFLAHEGLLAQHELVLPRAASTIQTDCRRPVGGALGDPAVTNAIFSPPLPE